MANLFFSANAGGGTVPSDNSLTAFECVVNFKQTSTPSENGYHRLGFQFIISVSNGVPEVSVTNTSHSGLASAPNSIVPTVNAFGGTGNLDSTTINIANLGNITYGNTSKSFKVNFIIKDGALVSYIASEIVNAT